MSTMFFCNPKLSRTRQLNLDNAYKNNENFLKGFLIEFEELFYARTKCFLSGIP